MEAGLAQGDNVPIEYEELVQPHVDSFDYFLGDGMQTMVCLMPSMQVGSFECLMCWAIAAPQWSLYHGPCTTL